MGYLDNTGLAHLWSKIKSALTGKLDTTGTAYKTSGIPYGECDSSSTSTVFTATVPGITSLYNGVCALLKNGVETSASGFTININNLGAKPVYNSMATGNDETPTAPTRETTIFNINYTMLFVYSEDLVNGGAWICYRGYDSNTNTIGYQLRTNSGNLVAADTGYRYRIWLTSADGSKWVPINTSTATNATTARTLNTRKIDPFGPIVYNSTNGTTNANARPGVTTLWQQYTLTIGYSYVISLTAWDSVYLRCTPQTDGSVVMHDITQSLPSTNDGYVYIYLGQAYSATAMELRVEHPVYYHDGTGIRAWIGRAIPTKTSDLNNDSGFLTSAVTSFNGSTGAVTYTAPVTSVNTKTGAVVLSASDVGALPSSTTIPSAATATPIMDGTGAVGSSSKYAKEDHVHPTDTSRQEALVSGTNIKTVNGNSLLGSGDLVIGGSSPTPMTDAEIEAAVSSVSVAHNITVSGSAASYTADGRFVLSAATAGEIVRIQANGTITSISSVPTVEFETDGAGSTDAKLFAMPNEAITITVTVDSGGGSN